MILNPITNLHSMTNVGFAFHSPSLVQDCVSPQELLHCKIYREVDLGLKRPKRYSFSLECYFFLGVGILRQASKLLLLLLLLLPLLLLLLPVG